MSWKCLFAHQWKYISHQTTQLFAHADDQKPYKRITRILKKCNRCSKFKTDEVEGEFTHVTREEMQ